MGKPKYYWYGIVKTMIMNAPKHSPNESEQLAKINEAMVDASDYIRTLPNGDLRMKAVDMILIRQTKNYEGAAMELHYEAKTIQKWVSNYIYLVGRKAGY